MMLRTCPICGATHGRALHWFDIYSHLRETHDVILFADLDAFAIEVAIGALTDEQFAALIKREWLAKQIAETGT